jgi:hypothetical protein
MIGSITAALLLSQPLSWQRRCQDPEGWWCKPQEEWTEEAGLSRRERVHARKTLRLLGILDEKLTGMPAKLWYRVNLVALHDAVASATRPLSANGL